MVIVNDASTDDSLEQAIAWQENSRHPVRIVDKRFNTGLADARNIGLQLARAPYAFIMDADNMVFPRALERVVHNDCEPQVRSGLLDTLPVSGRSQRSGGTAFLF